MYLIGDKLPQRVRNTPRASRRIRSMGMTYGLNCCRCGWQTRQSRELDGKRLVVALDSWDKFHRLPRVNLLPCCMLRMKCCSHLELDPLSNSASRNATLLYLWFAQPITGPLDRNFGLLWRSESRGVGYPCCAFGALIGALEARCSISAMTPPCSYLSFSATLFYGNRG